MRANGHVPRTTEGVRRAEERLIDRALCRPCRFAFARRHGASRGERGERVRATCFFMNGVKPDDTITFRDNSGRTDPSVRSEVRAMPNSDPHKGQRLPQYAPAEERRMSAPVDQLDLLE